MVKIMVKMFALIAISITFFCVYPATAQSPPAQQKIIEPTPKQEGAAASSPTQVRQTSESTKDNQKATNKPLPAIKEIAPIPSKEKTEKPYDYQDANLKIQRELSKSSKVIAKFTIFLVVVGFLQIFCLFGQLRLLRETNKISKSSQRAYVFVRNMKIDPIDEPKQIIIVPEWYNNGSTQANYLLTHVNMNYFPLTKYPQGLPKDFTFPDYGEVGKWPMQLGPKGIFYGEKLIINEKNLGEIMVGAGCIYIWGWVEYSDIFDSRYRHKTEFCNEIVVDIHGIRLGFHDQHNGSDDYCFKKPMTKYIPPT